MKTEFYKEEIPFQLLILTEMYDQMNSTYHIKAIAEPYTEQVQIYVAEDVCSDPAFSFPSYFVKLRSKFDNLKVTTIIDNLKFKDIERALIKAHFIVADKYPTYEIITEEREFSSNLTNELWYPDTKRQSQVKLKYGFMKTDPDAQKRSYHGRPVKAVHVETREELIFKNGCDAKKAGFNSGNISMAVRNLYKNNGKVGNLYKGYRWSRL